MKRILFALSLLVCSSAAMGQGDLGRLFFTPAERDVMDRVRRGERVTPNTTQAHEFNGFLRRSDGINSIWIDGRSYPATPGQLQRLAALPMASGSTISVRVTSTVSDPPAAKPVPSRRPSKKQN